MGALDEASRKKTGSVNGKHRWREEEGALIWKTGWRRREAGCARGAFRAKFRRLGTSFRPSSFLHPAFLNRTQFVGHTYRQPLLKTILRVHTCPRHPSFSSRTLSPRPSFTYEPGPTAEIERGRLWAEEDTFMMTFARRNLDDIRCASVLYLDYFLRWCALWKERGSMNRGISFFFVLYY